MYDLVRKTKLIYSWGKSSRSCVSLMEFMGSGGGRDRALEVFS